jgi:vancomycin resistance protein YoaR
MKNRISIVTSLEEIGISIDRDRIVEEAFNTGRNNNKINNFLTFLLNTSLGFTVPSYFYVNEEKLDTFIFEKLNTLYKEEERPIASKLSYIDGKYVASHSQKGKGVDSILLASELINYIENPDYQTIYLGNDVIKNSPLKKESAAQTAAKANEIIENVSKIKAHDKTWELNSDTIASFMNFKKVPNFDINKDQFATDNQEIFQYIYNNLTGILPENNPLSYKLEIDYDEKAINNYLTKIAPEIEQEAVNATIRFQNNNLEIVTEGQDKINLDQEGSIASIIEGLTNKQPILELKLVREHPQISHDTIDELGIKTLIGKGTSNFSGSPKNRRHNIAVGSSKFDGIIIKPEETFSFIEILGPVDASTGYLPELVIKNDKTVPEYGGGMCQVSSTAFRGAVNSGLLVTERRNHAYPVQYYAPQGTDATVYIPKPDLQFINNTPGHILLQTIIEGNTLTFEFYGTSDGRRVETEGPITYDKKPDGSMKAKWVQKVYTSEGTLLFEKTFLSKYDSPSKYPHPGEEPPKDDKDKKKKKKKKKEKKD